MEKRIIVVDNDPVFPDFIQEMLNDVEGFKVSRVAATKDDFFHMIQKEPFDMVILDISIGGREGGIEILQTLKEKGANLPVIVFSAHSEIDYGLICLQAGAKGYVNKSDIYSTLVHALKVVEGGNLFVSGKTGVYILNQYKSKEGLYAK